MKLLVALIFIFSSPMAFADIEKFDDKLATVSLIGIAPGYGLDFTSTGPSGSKVAYTPHTKILTGIGISIHRWFGFSLTTKNSYQEKDILKNGDTSYNDYRFNIAFDKFLINLSYSRYVGFYIQNTDQIDPAVAATGENIKLPDMSLENIGASFAYIFNSSQYSLPASIDQTQRQQSSAGSWLAGASFSDITFDNNNQPFLPTSIASNFGSDQNLIFGRFKNYTIDGGYGYTLVGWKYYFLSVTGMYGMGLQERFIRSATEETHGWYSTKRLAGDLTMGYNGDDFLATLGFRFDGTSFDLNSMTIGSSIWSMKLAMGTRF